MSFFDEVGSLVSGFVGALTGDYPSPPIRVPVPEHTVFQSLVRQISAHFSAEIHWDEDGDTGAVLGVQSDSGIRTIVVYLKNGTLHVAAPCDIRFSPGCLPRDVAAFLSQRNAELPYADWDAINNGRQSYFTLKAQGRMGEFGIDTLKLAIRKMLVESLTIDIMLRKRGYC